MKSGFILTLIVMGAALATQTEYVCNYNASHTNDAFAGDAVSLPVILNNPGDGKSNLPLTETYSIQRYELKDTNYTANPEEIGDVEHEILYKKEPPNGVFDVYRITMEDY